MAYERKDTLSLIGNTPLLELRRLHNGPGRLLAKAELFQPGGSVKDRPALKIIQLAYQSGLLKAGQPVVEMTSGNMGAGLAVVCAVYGNPFVAVMSSGNSPERAKMLRGLGAEVVLVSQVDGAPGQVTGADIARATEVAKEFAQERGAFYVDQFNNPGSVLAHYETTGPEIWNELDGELSAFVASIGSGGTFIGTSKFLKSKNSKVKCIPAEPEGADILATGKVIKPRHLLQGTGYGIVPPHWDSDLVDEFLTVTDDEATSMRTELANKEGLFVGYSAAANVVAAAKVLRSLNDEKATVVTVLCDTGLKY
jgi:cysteine synthase A